MRSIKKFRGGGDSKKSQYWDGNKWTFSLGNLKAIIDLKEEDIPERYKKDIDKCFDQIHYDKVRKTGENVLLFDIFPSDKNAERFEKYIKSGNRFSRKNHDAYATGICVC